MSELGKENKKTSPLPKDLQDLVDKDEEDLEIRADFENSWTTTRAQDQPSKRPDNPSTESVDALRKTEDQPPNRGAEKEKLL